MTLQYLNELLPTLAHYGHLVVDISGLPRTVFFPLLSFLISKAEKGEIRNLHVAVAEDAELDGRLRGREYGIADYIHTFRLAGKKKLVWLPVIDQYEAGRLNRIYDKIRADCVEICPILPFPASNLRRGDDILVNLRDVLFEGLSVSKENIILCDEKSPFDVYRKLVEIDEYYRGRLADLPGMEDVTTVVSPLSSKTLSLGMVLASVERRLPVCYVEAGSYNLDPDAPDTFQSYPGMAPLEVWLTGEPYRTD